VYVNLFIHSLRNSHML